MTLIPYASVIAIPPVKLEKKIDITLNVILNFRPKGKMNDR